MSATTRPDQHAGPVGGGTAGRVGGGPDAGRAAGPGSGDRRSRLPRAALVAVGLVLALVAVAAVALAAVSLLVRQQASGGQEVPDVSAVRVENRCGGGVEVTGLGFADTGGVDVAWDDAWSFGRPRHGQLLEAGRLVVRVGCPPVGVGVGTTSRLRVQVPGGVPVEVDAGSGDVTAAGLVRLREVRTGSGDVTVTAPAGDAGPGVGTTVRTGSGDVVLRGTGGDLDVGTGSGDVRAVDLSATSVRVHVGSGDVDLRAVGLPQDVTARTGSGDVTVTVPDTPVGYAVRATTGSGQALVGVTRNPSSPQRMVLLTGSGDVEVLPGPSRSG